MNIDSTSSFSSNINVYQGLMCTVLLEMKYFLLIVLPNKFKMKKHCAFLFKSGMRTNWNRWDVVEMDLCWQRVMPVEVVWGDLLCRK